MKVRRILRAGFLASVSIGTLALVSCATGPAYVICNDTVANSNCPDDTAPVVVDNTL